RDRVARRRARRVHRGRRDAEHRSAGRWRRGRARDPRPGQGRPLRRPRRRRDHRRSPRRAARADGRDGGPRRTPLHRRRPRRAGQPADATRARVRVGARRHPCTALRGRIACRWGSHARGRVVEPARYPRRARRGRGVDGDARHRAGQADRWRRALPAPVDRRRHRDGPRREGRRTAGHRRGDTASLHPHRRVLRGLRPGVQGQPAAAHPRRRRRRASGSGGRCDRRDRYRPRTTPAGGQGAALRRGASWHARPRDRARAGDHRARRRSVGGPRAAVVVARRYRAHRRHPWRPDRGRSPSEPLRDRPACDVDRGSVRAREPQSQHPLCRAPAHRSGAAHVPVGRAGRGRWRGGAMTAAPKRAGRAVRPALLVLADGTVFEGEAVGAQPVEGIATGEVVFNTVLTGYQEVITDPSYAGQIITFTYPHIGNYGTNPADLESRRPFCRGVVVRDLARRHSSWRSDGDLDTFLRVNGVAGIAGVDTRRLTRHLREAGSMPGAFGTAAESDLRAAAAREPGTSGVDLVRTVTTDAPYTHGDGPRRVVAYDFGIKRTILRHLGGRATVEVVPAWTAA